jgi:hypothetical protein
MREILRNPMLYYVLAPILVGLWPLLVWGVYLPRARQNLLEDLKQYEVAESHRDEIAHLDPGRLEAANATRSAGKFTYYDAVARVADRCRISSRNYNVNAGNIIRSGGKESQGARVTLTDVDIVQACNFLWTIQSMWVNLECESFKLQKKQGLLDSWDVDLSFKYNY